MNDLKNIDTNKQSIQEIWNSNEALLLRNIPQESISPDSACRYCKEYKECKLSFKQKCWRDTLKAYGEDKWDFPDIKCPKAPQPFFEMDFH